jgi:hypothetical protein
VNDQSRRGFLAIAGTGAAAAGITALAPAASAKTDKPSVPKHASGAVVAHVHDVHSDTVVLYVDEREVVVHDRDLVARLARAAH